MVGEFYFRLAEVFFKTLNNIRYFKIKWLTLCLKICPKLIGQICLKICLNIFRTMEAINENDPNTINLEIPTQNQQFMMIFF